VKVDWLEIYVPTLPASQANCPARCANVTTTDWWLRFPPQLKSSPAPPRGPIRLIAALALAGLMRTSHRAAASDKRRPRPEQMTDFEAITGNSCDRDGSIQPTHRSLNELPLSGI